MRIRTMVTEVRVVKKSVQLGYKVVDEEIEFFFQVSQSRAVEGEAS